VHSVEMQIHADSSYISYKEIFINIQILTLYWCTV